MKMSTNFVKNVDTFQGKMFVIQTFVVSGLRPVFYEQSESEKNTEIVRLIAHLPASDPNRILSKKKA